MAGRTGIMLAKNIIATAKEKRTFGNTYPQWNTDAGAPDLPKREHNESENIFDRRRLSDEKTKNGPILRPVLHSRCVSGIL